MIVSEKRKYIFVHIFKTAGTSVKRALRRDSMKWWQEPLNFVFKRIGIPQFGPVHYPDHFSASEIIAKIGREQFDSFYSFAFVRNPWDWEVSHYKYICRNRKHPDHPVVAAFPDFDSYVNWRCEDRFRLQQDYLKLDGEIVVDFVGRFENLAADFQKVCSQVGINRRLPKLNATRKVTYTSFYTPDLADRIRTVYRSDIELFGYEFDGTVA